MEGALKGRSVWVTGAARGIGKCIATELASRGAALGLTDVLEAELAAVADDIRAAHRVSVITARLDVTDSAAAEQFTQRCASELGGLTALVNNAGITRDALLIRMSDEDWDRVISVNLKGTFVCTKAAVRVMMKARYGKIVNMASVVGVMGNSGQANYAASKAGIIGFTKSVAKEFAARGVRANAIAPGFVQTEMTQQLSQEVKDAYLKSIPLGYLGTPEDIARVCAFLISPESDYITGQVLVVDGGMHT